MSNITTAAAISFTEEDLRRAYGIKETIIRYKEIEGGVVVVTHHYIRFKNGKEFKEVNIASAATIDLARLSVAQLDGKLEEELEDIEIPPVPSKGEAKKFFFECAKEFGAGFLVFPVNPTVQKWVGGEDSYYMQYDGKGGFIPYK